MPGVYQGTALNAKGPPIDNLSRGEQKSAAAQRSQLDLLAEMAEEAFMPLAYGGGVRSVSEVRAILSLGFEKVILNTATHSDPSFVTEAARTFGRSTVVGSMDVRRKSLGRQELVSAATNRLGSDPIAEARRLESLGVGEILLQSVCPVAVLTSAANWHLV